MLPVVNVEYHGVTVYCPAATRYDSADFYRRCWAIRHSLTADRYFKGIPADSRAGHDPRFLRPTDITEDVLKKTKELNDHAQSRGQTLAQMALSWVLRHPVVASALIGASKASQVDDCVGAVKNLNFTAEELVLIDGILG